MSNNTTSENKKLIYVFLLPIMFCWSVIINYILFYVFDLLDFVEKNNLDVFHSRIILLCLWAVPASITVSFTGMFIDRFPNSLNKLVISSTALSSLSLILVLYAFIIINSTLMIVGTVLFGFFIGIAIISGQTLYSIIIPFGDRNKAYSFVIFGASIISVLSVAFFDSYSPNNHFLMPLAIVSVLGLIITVIVLYYSRVFDFTWKNDKWPTKLGKILSRPSVIVYFCSHTLIWLMLGLMIGSLAQVQKADTLDLLQNFFSISPYKGFWIVVLVGSLISVVPASILSDRIGRKSLIIFSTTGIVLASLVVAIFDLFLISTLIIGFSFACVHAFSSLWVDLSSRDAIGRYNSLNFQSLGLGFIIGFSVSFFLSLDQAQNLLQINIFILIGLAVFASLPLFWISDSFPPLEFFLLLVTNKSGIPLFHYDFNNDDGLKVDLALVSGALIALSTFMVEATGESTGRLSLVRHGTHFILSDEGKFGLTGAIFANKNDPELQRLLKKFLTQFQEKYEEELSDWRGDIGLFRDSVNDAEEIFGHLISIKT